MDNGWLPSHAADWLSERYPVSRPIIDEAAAAAGRDPREIATIFNFPGDITDRPLATTRDGAGRWTGGLGTDARRTCGCHEISDAGALRFCTALPSP